MLVKNYIVVFLFLAFSTLSAQNLIDENGLKQGKWEKKYDWGTTRYTGQFENDKEVGTFLFYDQNGKILSKRDYISPGGKAMCTMFDYEEWMHAKGELLGKKKIGTWYYFANNGKDTIGIEIFVDGLLEGVQYTYFENGNITEISNYTDGIQQGEWKEFFADGVVNVEGLFKDGKLNGPVVYYFSTGEVRKKGQYKNGLKNGIWLTYDQRGKVIKKVDQDKLVDKTRLIRR